MKTITMCLQAVLLSVVVLLTSGCMSHQYGTKIDQSKISQIKKGVTTKAEVEVLLGAPTMVSMIGEGRRMMSYTYTESSAQATATSYIPVVGLLTGGATGHTRTQTLQIMIAKSGVVEDYEFSDNTQNLESGGGLANTSVKSTTAPAGH